MTPLLTPARSRKQAASAARLPPWLRHAVRTALHLISDAAAIALAYRLAYLLRFDSAAWVARFPIPGGDAPPWSLYQRILPALIPLWLAIFWYSSKLYNSPWMKGADRFLQIVKGCILGTAASLVATYIYGRLEYSRMMLLLAWPISAVLVSVGQALVLWFDEMLSLFEAARPVIIVGRGAVADMITGRIRARHPEAEISEIGELPPSHELDKALRTSSYYELILLRSSLAHSRILEAAELCEANGVRFTMVPDLLELRLGEIQMNHSLGLPAYRIEHSQLTPLNFLAKRTFDLIFSSLLLAAVSVPLALVCLLIKLDSAGPILYKQKRYGFRGRVFFAYKFRTMVADAEAKIESVKELNTHKGAFFKAKNDPRITGVGKWLRRFSLDEFPQFINVIKGEMSVVGPRPLALTTGELESLERDFGATAKKRMNILPGITGLWQVSGRSDVSNEQRFSLDLFYVEHWSLGLDLEIILKTVPAMFFAKGAY